MFSRPCWTSVVCTLAGLALGSSGLSQFDADDLLRLLCVLTGASLGLGGGLYLLANQRRSPETGVIEVQLPFLGKVSTKTPSVLLLILGFVLVYAPIAPSLDAPQKIPISGKVRVEGQGSNQGFMVGFVPDSATTWTNSDGTFRVEVSESELPYRGIVFVREGSRERIFSGPVTIDAARGSFDVVVPVE